MFLVELARSLLGFLLSFEFSLVDELKDGVDWLVLGLSLVWHILASNQVHLKGVQLLSQEVVQERLVNVYCDVQVQEFKAPQLVKLPFHFLVGLSLEEEGRQIELNSFLQCFLLGLSINFPNGNWHHEPFEVLG